MKLKHLSIIKSGYPFRGRIAEVADSGITAVQLKNVSLRHGIDWGGCIDTELGLRDPRWLKAGDVLFAARGSQNYAVAVSSYPEECNVQAVASPHFYVLNVTADDLLPEYLAWFLNQAPSQRYFEQTAEGTLTKSIRRSVLENIPIVVPTLQKQKTIVDLAKAVSDEQSIAEALIEKNQLLLNAIANDLIKEQARGT